MVHIVASSTGKTGGQVKQNTTLVPHTTLDYESTLNMKTHLTNQLNILVAVSEAPTTQIQRNLGMQQPFHPTTCHLVQSTLCLCDMCVVGH